MLVNASVWLALAAMGSVVCVTTAARVLNLRAMDAPLPQELETLFVRADRARSKRYVRATSALETAREWVSLAATAAFLLAGGLGWLDTWAWGLNMGSLGAGMAFVGGLCLAQFLIDLPFDAVSTFRIESGFGFNTTTWRVFAADKLKGLALMLLLGGAILAAVLALFQACGAWAWLAAWVALSAVTSALVYVTPVWILPLFNTFKPLEPTPLRRAIEEYVAAQGFSLEGVFVMDGSKRSTKANAFFTGFGDKKRISLYDTLLSALADDEVLAVLAHEMGHARRRHQLKGLALVLAKMGALLFLLQQFLTAGAVQLDFGAVTPSVHAGLVLFGLYYQPLALGMQVLANACSRAWEYEADAYAAAGPGGPQPLVRALTTLSEANLANLTPHPLTVWLTAVHPPILQRIRALNRLDPRTG